MRNSLTWRLSKNGSVVVFAGLLLGSCTQETVTDQSKAQSNNEDAEQVLEDTIPGSSTGLGKPDIAFFIEDDLYAVPLAVDREGCEQFTTWSESGVKSLAQPIYFHDGEGSFSPTKVEGASCNASMIETEIDGKDCPTFRAQQPDGTSSEVVYYQSRNGYTIKKERSTCG